VKPAGKGHEFITAKGEDPVDSHQAQEYIHHRIVRHPQFVLSFVEKIAEKGPVKGEPEIGDSIGRNLNRAITVGAGFQSFCHNVGHHGRELVHQGTQASENHVVA